MNFTNLIYNNMTHTCSRPRNRPASITHTLNPFSCNARAINIPKVPPHTTTSKSSADDCRNLFQQRGLPCAPSSVTNNGATRLSFKLLLNGFESFSCSHRSSAFKNAS